MEAVTHQDHSESSTSHTGSYSVQNRTQHPAGCRNVMKPAANPLPGCPSLATLSYGEREMVVFAAMMDQDIAPLELRVLIYINHVLYSSSGRADIGQALLARRLKSTIPRISAAVATLEAHGYIQVDRCDRQRKYGLIRQDVVWPVESRVEPQHVPEPVTMEEERLPEPVTMEEACLPEPVTVEPQHLPEPVTRTFNSGTVKEEAPSSPPRAAATAAKPPAKRKPKIDADNDLEIRLPADFAPTPEMVATAVAKHGMSERKIQQHTENFCGHFIGKPKTKRTRVGWQLSWWRWIRESAPGGEHHRPEKAAQATEHHRAGNLGLARPLTQDEWKKRRH